MIPFLALALSLTLGMQSTAYLAKWEMCPECLPPPHVLLKNNTGKQLIMDRSLAYSGRNAALSALSRHFL